MIIALRFVFPHDLSRVTVPRRCKAYLVSQPNHGLNRASPLALSLVPGPPRRRRLPVRQARRRFRRRRHSRPPRARRRGQTRSPKHPAVLKQWEPRGRNQAPGTPGTTAAIRTARRIPPPARRLPQRRFHLHHHPPLPVEPDVDYRPGQRWRQPHRVLRRKRSTPDGTDDA